MVLVLVLLRCWQLRVLLLLVDLGCTTRLSHFDTTAASAGGWCGYGSTTTTTPTAEVACLPAFKQHTQPPQTRRTSSLLHHCVCVKRVNVVSIVSCVWGYGVILHIKKVVVNLYNWAMRMMMALIR